MSDEIRIVCAAAIASKVSISCCSFSMAGAFLGLFWNFDSRKTTPATPLLNASQLPVFENPGTLSSHVAALSGSCTQMTSLLQARKAGGGLRGFFIRLAHGGYFSPVVPLNTTQQF